MIVFSSDKLYKEYFDDDLERFVREDFSIDDSLFYHLKDPVLFEEDTTLENIIWAFVNDNNSDKLFDSLKSVTKKNLRSFFKSRLNSGSEAILRSNIDWIEFSPTPIVGFTDSLDGNKLDTQSFKFHEEKWNIIAWNVEEESIESVNISSFSLEKLLDTPVKLDNEVPVYNDDWNCEGFYEDIPSVLDILECLCYEFYCYRNEHGKDHSEVGKEMISLTDLLEKRKN